MHLRKVDENCVAVWVMKEFGKGESWYRIDRIR